MIIMNFISTGSRMIDEILGGGIPKGMLTLVYGGVATGKTTLLLQTSLMFSNSGYGFMYVDCMGKVTPRRLQALADHMPCILSNGFLLSASTFEELYDLVLSFERLISFNLRLIALDSLTRPYRAMLGSRSKNVRLNRLLNRVLAMLFKLSRYYGVTIVISGDARYSPQRKVLEPVASGILKYWCDVILSLHREGEHIVLKIEKHFLKDLLGHELICKIVDSGIKGLYEDEE